MLLSTFVPLPFKRQQMSTRTWYLLHFIASFSFLCVGENSRDDHTCKQHNSDVQLHTELTRKIFLIILHLKYLRDPPHIRWTTRCRQPREGTRTFIKINTQQKTPDISYQLMNCSTKTLHSGLPFGGDKMLGPSLANRLAASSTESPFW